MGWPIWTTPRHGNLLACSATAHAQRSSSNSGAPVKNLCAPKVYHCHGHHYGLPMSQVPSSMPSLHSTIGNGHSTNSPPAGARASDAQFVQLRSNPFWTSDKDQRRVIPAQRAECGCGRTSERKRLVISMTGRTGIPSYGTGSSSGMTRRKFPAVHGQVCLHTACQARFGMLRS